MIIARNLWSGEKGETDRSSDSGNLCLLILPLIDLQNFMRIPSKGNALNQIAAASGRDPAAIVKSVADAEKAAKVEAKKREEARNLAEQVAADDDISTDDAPPAQRLYNSLTSRDRYRYVATQSLFRSLLPANITPM